MVLDCLFEHGPHNTHFCLPAAAALIRELRPRKALLVGMSCDAFPAHEEMNERLREMFPPEMGIEVKLAHDGLKVPVEL